MFIVLPKERHGLKAVLEGLNGPALLKIVKNRKRNDVVVRTSRETRFRM